MTFQSLCTMLNKCHQLEHGYSLNILMVSILTATLQQMLATPLNEYIGVLVDAVLHRAPSYLAPSMQHLRIA